MSEYQTGRQIAVSYKKQDSLGTRAAASGAKHFRANGGGLSMTKSTIESGENRTDGQKTRGRHGSKSVSGSYSGDMSIGTWDELLEAVFRGTFAAATTITESEMSSATIGVASNVVTFSAGAALTAGVRVGQVHRWTSGLATADLNRNLRVIAATDTTITYAETLTDVAGPVAAYSLTIPKTVLMGTTRRLFTFEEHELNIDGSEIFDDCRIGSVQISLDPDGMGTLTFGIVGRDMDTLEDGDSPYFTATTRTVTLGLTSVEAKIRVGADDLVDLTTLNLEINLNADGIAVIGSTITPDVFDNDATVTMSATALRKDLSKVKNFLAEDQLSVHLLFTEPTAEPQAFMSFFVGNTTLSQATKSELGQDGPRSQDLQFLVGIDERGGAWPVTTVMYQTSAA